MKIFRFIFSPLWKIWFVLWFSIPFIILFPLFYIAFVTRQKSLVFKLKRLWARTICFGSFIYPKIRYQSKAYQLPKNCVIVPNHTSYLDIVFCPFYITHPAYFMGKAELLKIPLFRYFFIYYDIPVNRKSVTGSHKAFLEAGERLRNGDAVVIYPEGTIGNRGKLRPFKNGAFKLAIEKQVPVVPVVNLNNWHFLENGGFFKANGRPGIPKILVGDAISTLGMTDKNVDELKNKVHTFMQEELDKYYGNKH